MSRVLFVATLISSTWLVAPHASAQPNESIAALVRAHDDHLAIAALEALPESERDHPSTRYLLARLKLRTGLPAEAADLLRPDEVPEVVRSRTRHLLALALTRSGRCEEARPLLRELVRGQSARASIARALQAECLVVLGESDLAEGRLRAVLAEDATGVDGFATRLLLAEVFADRGDREAAVRELRTLLLQRAGDSRISNVESILAGAGERIDYTFGERLIRANRLSLVGDHEGVVRELDAAGRPTRGAQLARWLHLRGMALYRMRGNYAEAAELLAESAALGGPDAIEDQFHAARALARSDQDDESIVAYRRFVNDHSRHERAAQAEYLAAWLEVRHERPEGERNLRAFLSGPRGRSDGRLRREAIWHLGFRAFERGDQRNAIRWLEQYWRLGESALVRSRGLYWLGRAKAASGDRDGAIDAYQRAVDHEPLHYYALLARQRLEALGQTPRPFSAPGDSSEPSPGLMVRLPQAVHFYYGLGLDGDALRALRAGEASVRASVPAGRGTQAAVQAYHQIGQFSRPYQMAVTTHRATLNAAPTSSTRWIWDAAYPRAYARHIEPAAAAQSIAPEYLWAIMRQESGYRPEAVSHADAVGLLQMLPSTAQRLAEELGLVNFDRSLLFIPEWNARLAAYYNARLYRQFGEVPPVAFAAFNAGEARAERWLNETGEIELDRFVERIPFDETRNYVRRVTSHYARYLYLRNPEGGWPLTLPETVGPSILTP